jgi:hypothetical protein
LSVIASRRSATTSFSSERIFARMPFSSARAALSLLLSTTDLRPIRTICWYSTRFDLA